MPLKSDPELGINSWLEDELYQQYLHDHSTVDESWKHLFKANGGEAALKPPIPSPQPPTPRLEGAALQPLRGAPARIAENMSALSIPLATSQRTIAVKVMDENRRIINQHRTLLGHSKVPTPTSSDGRHPALEELPALNHAYAEKDGQPYRARTPRSTSVSPSIGVAGKDRARSLMVPNIKNAGALNFQEYVAAFDDLVSRARPSRLTPADFQGTTISLTNPGTVGTMFSNPRLMPGQGAIIAAGAIDYPAEYRRRRRRDPRRPRHLQGDDPHLHLRPPHHPGRGIRRLPRPHPVPASMATTASTRRYSPTSACRRSPSAGKKTASPNSPA